MRTYIQQSIRAKLRNLFPDDDAETALSWWIATEGRPPVVVVGAGFTRNALDRLTGQRVAPALVPLWQEVLLRFGDNLRATPSGVDALTFAELHEEGLGQRKHLDTLLTMLPDDRLDLGPAHEALFDLRPVSIVTTNFLDTVLDRHHRAVPVFEDPAAALRVDPAERTEVLYLHGHRSSPSSWVLTRSQYDTLEETRPVLLTRVRQLFAQHPVLTLGFGLADPDFHQIHRQIHERMKGSQPLGLTLLGPASEDDRGSELESAFRRHWEKQGLRIVRFKDWKEFDKNLTAFLRLPGKLDLAECQRLLCESGDFTRKMRFARSVFDDPDAEKRIDVDHGWQETLWRVCLDEDFTASERAEIQANMDRSAAFQTEFGRKRRVSARESASSPEASESQPPPKLSTPLLNEGLGYVTWALAWTCDKWWQSNRDKLDLLAWLHERVSHRDWPVDLGHGSDVRIAEILMLLLESIPEPLRRHINANIGIAAMRLLRRYDPQTVTRLEGKFESLRDLGRLRPEDQHHKVLGHMAEGFRAALNGDHVGATVAYDKATEEARRIADPLAIWLAAWGRRVSHDLSVEDRADEERGTQKRYRTEAVEAARHAVVVDWQNTAQERLLNLRKLTVADLRDAEGARAFQRTSMRFTDVPYLAWRTLRDLEALNAHPMLQREHLLPLLDHGLGDVAEEVRYRLTFDVDGFTEWSQQAIEDVANDGRAAYDARTEALVSAWLSVAESDPPVSTFVACLRTLPALRPFVRVGHVDRVRGVLASVEGVRARAMQAKFFGPQGIRTYRGTTDLGGLQLAAWRAWLDMRGSREDFVAFRAWADKVRPMDLFDPHRGFARFRWEALVRAGVSADDLVDWLASNERLEFLERAHPSVAELLGVTLWRLAVIEPHGLTSVDAWRRAAYAIGRLLPKSADLLLDSNGFVVKDDLLAAGFGVLGAWEARAMALDSGPALPQELSDVKAHLEKLAKTFFETPVETSWTGMIIVQSLSLAAAVIRYDAPARRSWASTLWARVVLRWGDVLAFCTNNYWSVRQVMEYLAALIEHDEASRSTARTKVLELLDISPTGLDALCMVVDPRFWDGASRADLLRRIRVGASGARGVFPGTWRLAVCDLLRRAALRTQTHLPDDLRFLVRQVSDLASNDDASVANHAAYAIEAVARGGVRTGDEELAKEVADALRGIAIDSRPGVRAAVAYSLGVLDSSEHGPLKLLGADLAKAFADDTYAQVRGELLAGQELVARRDVGVTDGLSASAGTGANGAPDLAP